MAIVEAFYDSVSKVMKEQKDPYFYFSSLCSFEHWLQYAVAWKYQVEFGEKLGWAYPEKICNEKSRIDIKVCSKDDDYGDQKPVALVEVKTLWNMSSFNSVLQGKKSSVRLDLKKLGNAKNRGVVKIELITLTYHDWGKLNQEYNFKPKLTMEVMINKVRSLIEPEGFKIFNADKPLVLAPQDKRKLNCMGLKNTESRILVCYKK